MKEKLLNLKEKYILFSFYIFITPFIILFLNSSFSTDSIYRRVISKTEPQIHLEKINYYKELFYLLDKAIFLSRNNAVNYSKKADYLWRAIEAKLESEFVFDKTQIENLYIKAINLNPTNYEYHLKLGWFYSENGQNMLAQEELEKAQELYKLDYQTNLYLIKHYIKDKKDWQAFRNLILYLYLTKNNQILKELESEIRKFSNISIDMKAKKIQYTFFYNYYIFNFKEKNFPNIDYLTIKVYIKDDVIDVGLYKNYELCKSFKKLEKENDYNVYELDLNLPSQKTSIDDFQIKATPLSSIQKIEIIKKF